MNTILTHGMCNMCYAYIMLCFRLSKSFSKKLLNGLGNDEEERKVRPKFTFFTLPLAFLTKNPLLCGKRIYKILSNHKCN